MPTPPRTFTKLPTCHNGETLTRFYAIIIDGDNTVRQRQLNPDTAQLATIDEIHNDLETQININTWLHLLHDPRIVSELRCEDIIYAGGASIWVSTSSWISSMAASCAVSGLSWRWRTVLSPSTMTV